MNEILELSWKTQAVLVGGYLSYVTAYAGRRESHGSTDLVGIILCFGGIGLIAMQITDQVGESKSIDTLRSSYLQGIVGVAAPLFSAVLWRRCVNGFAHELLHKLTDSKEDGLPSAWATIIQRQGLSYSQLVVTLKSGDSYESYPLGRFNGYPNGPCVLGSDGSIGMYVTYITPAEGDGREVEDVDDGDGFRMTFIPSTEIAEVDLRRD